MQKNKQTKNPIDNTVLHKQYKKTEVKVRNEMNSWISKK